MAKTHKQQFVEMKGRKVGRLLVIKQALSIKGKAQWICECDCGEFVVASGDNLRRGNTTSCGCYESELSSRRMKNYRKDHSYTPHGHARRKKHTQTYRAWCGMRRRCYDPKCKNYKDYGGRGIRVCDRWLGAHGFENFLEDMGECPPDKNSLGRKNNDGNYEPTNCCWEDDFEQANNKRSSVMVEHRNRKQTATQWARELGCKVDALYARKRYGWSDERIIETPIRQRP